MPNFMGQTKHLSYTFYKKIFKIFEGEEKNAEIIYLSTI